MLPCNLNNQKISKWFNLGAKEFITQEQRIFNLWKKNTIAYGLIKSIGQRKLLIAELDTPAQMEKTLEKYAAPWNLPSEDAESNLSNTMDLEDMLSLVRAHSNFESTTMWTIEQAIKLTLPKFNAEGKGNRLCISHSKKHAGC
eukprot:Gb_02665 [translate_table: standard]